MPAANSCGRETVKGHMKGNVMQTGVEFALAIVFIAIVIGVGAITLAAFGTGQTGYAAQAISNGSISLQNLSGQLPTVGVASTL